MLLSSTVAPPGRSKHPRADGRKRGRGVPARVAAHLGVKVLAFSNLQDWTTEISAISPWQTRSGASYKQAFSTLPGQTEKIEAAKQLLEARLAGKIDSATNDGVRTNPQPAANRGLIAPGRAEVLPSDDIRS